jgi:Flp pilus assembly pilin Flp
MGALSLVQVHQFITRLFHPRSDSEQGASLVEYVLLIGLIALVCILAVTFFGTSVSTRYSTTGSAVLN